MIGRSRRRPVVSSSAAGLSLVCLLDRLVEREVPAVLATALELGSGGGKDERCEFAPILFPGADPSACLFSLDRSPEAAGPGRLSGLGGEPGEQGEQVDRALPVSDPRAQRKRLAGARG